MGYILPITHYDYKQYQNRMKETEESPHYISNVYKPVFHRISEKYEENESTYEPLAEKQQDKAPINKADDFYHISKGQKAILTGKGGAINEQT